ncbi:cilia- and flagella-associated protein 251-like [Capsicum annuum]|uniref:cilia- and flagella-associated protein 251-like n=1 Tax=Capsicum annuum TaxID=4072 RepID=UPI001FB120CE|nr:cilia- and flagella-associated protein 251-like [Capsicum annuum]
MATYQEFKQVLVDQELKKRFKRDYDGDLGGNPIGVHVGDDDSSSTSKDAAGTSSLEDLYKHVAALEKAALNIAAYIREKRINKKKKDERQHERVHVDLCESERKKEGEKRRKMDGLAFVVAEEEKEEEMEEDKIQDEGGKVAAAEEEEEAATDEQEGEEKEKTDEQEADKADKEEVEKEAAREEGEEYVEEKETEEAPATADADKNGEEELLEGNKKFGEAHTLSTVDLLPDHGKNVQSHFEEEADHSDEGGLA